MKRTIFTLLVALMLIPNLTACSQAPEVPTQETAGTTESSVSTTAPAVEFEEILLVDDENCTFKIVSTDTESIWGYTLNVYLENKTDMELMFSLENVSVNGYMCDPFWASSVSAGKKANEQISFFESDFEKNGITEVSEIDFTLNVYDSNDWTTDHLISQAFTIHP